MKLSVDGDNLRFEPQSVIVAGFTGRDGRLWSGTCRS